MISRLKFLIFFFCLFGLAISARLFYWQIISASELVLKAQNQYFRRFEIPAQRGEILTLDGFPLVINKEAYLLYANPQKLTDSPAAIAKKLATILSEGKISTSFAPKEEDKNAVEKQKNDLSDLENNLTQALSQKNLAWVMLAQKIEKEKKEQIEKEEIAGLDFQKDQKRFYPEGSMAAQLLGFVGSDEAGRDTGYFGLEGQYNLQLKGRPGQLRQETDPQGRPILTSGYLPVEPKNGNSIVLTIDRSAQLIVEEQLKKAIERYQAKGGVVVIMDPKTGALIAAASFPSYDQANWQEFGQSLFKNPIVADTYEPGSTFKLVGMSAAINEKAVEPETVCDQCDGPREIGGYTIRTWNNKYFPNSTATEIIQHSDNVGMVYVAEKLGIKKFYQYLQKFGIGQATGVDLQEEGTAKLRDLSQWKPIDLATASFGQGIAVTPIQMVRAVATIANGGNLVKPYLVQKIIGSGGQTTEIKPQIVREKVISQKTAKIITEMMVNAVDNGEAKAFKPQGFRFAGKTGTAQIPVEGHYDPEKTIASFVGFGPPDNPRFVMLVRIDQPQTSKFGSETAAPTFFAIARELYNYWGIAPNGS